MGDSVRGRKNTQNNTNGSVNGHHKSKPVETSWSKQLFCALGSLFGVQGTENADVAPQTMPVAKRQSVQAAPQKPPSPPKSPQTHKQAPKPAPEITQSHWTQDLLEAEAMNTKQKSLFLAYFLWLFGGVLGLHLYYLERDTQAFLTWSTFGGYGVGWLSDIVKIPRYVRDCNNDPRHLATLIVRMRKNRKPPFSTSRFVSAIMVGYLWGQLVMNAIPQDEVYGINWNTYLHWFIPLAVSLGVWVVGNIGREQGSPWVTIIVTYAAYSTRWLLFDENLWLSIVVLSAPLAFDSFSKEWRRTPKKRRSKLRRISTLFAFAAIYVALWSSYAYFNGKITDSNGDEIPIHEAIHHFFTSPWWTDLKQSLYDVYTYAQHHGWYEVWKQIIDLSDPQGEQNAYKVLGVSPTASQQEITAKWRALSREHHPDKCKDPEKQQEAQNRFMEIQQAYEILSNIKSKRKRKNNKSVFDEN